MPALKDLTGQRFGLLVVRRRAPQNTNTGRPLWECSCDCGRTSLVRTSDLQGGKQTSCGCRKDQLTAARNTKHGLAKRGHLPPEYATWQNMKRRCLDPTHDAYGYYGGRGIRIAPQWLDDFEQFFRDLGPRPTPGHSLDRRDVNGHYEPGNCRWATRKEQRANTREMILKFDRPIAVLNTIPQRPASIAYAELAQRTGIPKPTLWRMLCRLVASGLVVRPELGRYSL